MTYLMDKYAEDEDRIALIQICKDLLADEGEQLNQDSINNMIYFMGMFPITIEYMQMAWAYLLSACSVIMTYMVANYMKK